MLDRNNVIHWIASDSAFQKRFGERYDNTSSGPGFGGHTGQTNFKEFLFSRPIGANVDDATSPSMAFTKLWSYGSRPVGGMVLHTYIGRLWWLQPSGSWYLAHWVPNAAIANLHWGIKSIYPTTSGGVKWPGPQTITDFPIGANLDR